MELIIVSYIFSIASISDEPKIFPFTILTTRKDIERKKFY